MISIVMTYFNRNSQLLRTLESFKRYDPKIFEVIIVDDASERDIMIPDYQFKVTIIKMKNKNWTNPEPAYNAGLKQAIGDIIILQNAECMHPVDVLSATNLLTEKNYITFGCYSQGYGEKLEVINNRGATFDGESAWYNHSIYRPVCYDFCAAITAGNIKKLNGYDERLSFGVAYGDNYLLHRIKVLGLKVILMDSPYVIHQWHERGLSQNPELYTKNFKLYNELIKEKDYRAKHVITEDL